MITICIPTIRPQNLPALFDAIAKNAEVDDYKIDWLEDVDREGCPKTLKKMVDRSEGDLICFLGDDTLPEPGFLKHALNTMATLPGGWGVVGLNSQVSKHAGHFLADKRMLPFLGGDFFNLEYWHCFCDHELTDIAQEMERYAFSEKAVVTHVHPAFKRTETDNDYNRVYSDEYYDHDRTVYYQRKRKRYGFKLGIGFPVIDKNVSLDFMVSFVTLEKPEYTLLVPRFATGEFYRDIAQVRNNLVDQALDEGCTHLWMIDTDQVYRDPKTIEKLLACDSMIAGGPVHRRYPPFDLILYRGTLGNYKYITDEIAYSGDVIDIDATGAGCLMFKMELFDQIKRPWFENWIHKDTGKPVGEDIGLCHKARTAGMQIRADTSIKIGHMTLFEVTEETYKLFCEVRGFKKTPINANYKVGCQSPG